MTKLIVKMEIPKDCPMCPMAHYDKLDQFTGCEVAPHKRNAVKTDKVYAESACRPDWCPIKGVLPDKHGDLIDRDKALNDIKRFICNGCYLREAEDDCSVCIVKAITDILCAIKPIIAAERKDE